MYRDLLTEGAWSNLVTDLPGNGDPTTVADTNQVPQRAYRIKVRLPLP